MYVHIYAYTCERVRELDREVTGGARPKKFGDRWSILILRINALYCTVTFICLHGTFLTLNKWTKRSISLQWFCRGQTVRLATNVSPDLASRWLLKSVRDSHHTFVSKVWHKLTRIGAMEGSDKSQMDARSNWTHVMQTIVATHTNATRIGQDLTEWISGNVIAHVGCFTLELSLIHIWRCRRAL